MCKSCADLTWEGLSNIIINLSKLRLDDEQLRNLTYQKWCNLLKCNAVLIAR